MKHRYYDYYDTIPKKALDYYSSTRSHEKKKRHE